MPPACASSRILAVFLLAVASSGFGAFGGPRPPLGEADLRFWLRNMVVDHGYDAGEVRVATGLDDAAIRDAEARFGLGSNAVSALGGDGLIKVRPYPGGRHPRLGFFDGAVDPQRDTKLSVFAPWAGGGYVVVDAPEAVWSNLGLTYLAHTHIATIWDKAGVKLAPVEWRLREDGAWTSERRLPNGAAFGVRAKPAAGRVDFLWWVRNGGADTLTNLRAQVCVMLGRAAGFEAQTNANKLLEPPFAAARDASGRRWIITAWDALDRVWANPPVPCIHADPKLADCPPGGTQAARGSLWFFEGADIHGELARLRGEIRDRPPMTMPVLEPIPDKLVVLTFDDSVASHATVVGPLLKKLGFNATFFITEGFSFATNKADYMTWEQIAGLSRDGFEIGNHTRSHMGVSADALDRLGDEIVYINDRCAAHGIPRPVSFAYPGNAIDPGALPILRRLGFKFARRGAQPEFAYETGRGVPYEPHEDHPLLIPTTGDARPTWTLDDLKRAVAEAREGRVAVLQFHGAPDHEHPWVNTPTERFIKYMTWLKENGYRCIALRDLGRFVNPDDAPSEPWGVIERRQAALAQRP
jgi:peptidoglycan-N-acetylglucosamine deacetylase